MLSKDGQAVIQTITVADHEFEAYKKETDFLRSYIFPGGLLPSSKRFEQEANKAGLSTHDTHKFGHDYARTLAEWLKNFDAVIPDVKKLGFDTGFIRLWRFYLAGCAAGFTSEYTNVQQVSLSHA